MESTGSSVVKIWSLQKGHINNNNNSYHLLSSYYVQGLCYLVAYKT